MPAKMTTTTIRETPIWTMRRRRVLGRAADCRSSVTGRSLLGCCGLSRFMGVDSVDPTLKGSIVNGFVYAEDAGGSPMLEVTDATVSYLKALLPLDTDPATAIRIEPSHNSNWDPPITCRPLQAPHTAEGHARAQDV